MKKIAVLALAFLLVVSIVPAQAQVDPDRLERIEAFLDTIGNNGNFNGAVLISQNGEVLVSRAYGLANVEWDIPNTVQTKFRIASLTKQFTAMAILLLQERGSLTVQDPVCQYFEECPEAWQDITIHHLLTHTSGIPEHVNPQTLRETGTSSIRPSEIIDLFKDRPLDFPPGETWQYSNSGYIVLGYIIDEVSGVPYQRFLRENFFEPLGMDDTGYEGSANNIIEHRAYGYTSLRRLADYINMSFPYAAGGLYSTVEDLNVWTHALHNGEVVSQESWDAMLEAAVPIEGEERYGYGLWIGRFPKDRLSIGHGGGLPGFTSMMHHWPDDDVTIVIMSNLEDTVYIIEESLNNMLLDEE